MEELNIDIRADPSRLEAMLSPHLQSFSFPEKHVIDNEFVETFAIIYDGEITVDGIEVAKSRFVSVDEVLADVKAEPSRYTKWFVNELQLLGDRIWFVAQSHVSH